jgi:hypothetical protein
LSIERREVIRRSSRTIFLPARRAPALFLRRRQPGETTSGAVWRVGRRGVAGVVFGHDEAVPDPVDGADRAGVEAGVGELAPQPRDVDIDRALVR